MRNPLFRCVMLFLTATILFGCSKSDNGGDRYTISGNGTGRQEVPEVITNGVCTVSGTYRVKEKEFRYSITYSDLSAIPTMMHFHGPADLGVNANILIPVTGFPQTASGNFSGVVLLTTSAEQETALLSGKMYFNIHTSTFPTGEVRAQIGVTRVN